MTCRIISPEPAVVGEGATWIASQDCLYWVDILGQRLFRSSLSGTPTESWSLPEMVGWVVPRAGRDDLLVGLQSGIHSLSLDPFELRLLVAVEPDRPENRLNDAKVDAEGRLWTGTMLPDGSSPVGSLYRLDRSLEPVRVDDGYLIPNGPAFSPDGRTCYHADTFRRVIYRFDVARDGALRGKSEWVRFEEGWGLPDGMTVDSQGYLWVAHWDGGRISRLAPDGRLDRQIPLPVSRVTSCVFGGAGLDRMFVTTAALDRVDEPLAGALFEVDVGVTGTPARPFSG